MSKLYKIELSRYEVVSLFSMARQGAPFVLPDQVKSVRAIIDRLRPQLNDNNIPDDFIMRLRP